MAPGSPEVDHRDLAAGKQILAVHPAAVQIGRLKGNHIADLQHILFFLGCAERHSIEEGLTVVGKLPEFIEVFLAHGLVVCFHVFL